MRSRPANRLELLGHLRAELARRHEHERAGLHVGRVDALDDRDRERERLARAGRALREDVAAAQRLGDDERLDLERRVDAARANTSQMASDTPRERKC